MEEGAAMDDNVETILELLGDPKDVDRGLQDFRKAAQVLSSRHPRLIDRYSKKWVAVYRGQVRASGKVFASVLAEVDKKGLPREHVIVRFIDRNQRTMIL